ncbi:unnamed protein product [Angiostrongylus costaricensis]|uniref:TFIIIC_delta domain-containing protein n=1 Tax=Angiostrongylus costaricensis TaxID=334426 RepID=A0A0R3PHJ7_ANGCS|nr:unnamed protein product [Angiostrongylus costaricensis]
MTDDYAVSWSTAMPEAIPVLLPVPHGLEKCSTVHLLPSLDKNNQSTDETIIFMTDDYAVPWSTSMPTLHLLPSDHQKKQSVDEEVIFMTGEYAVQWNTAIPLSNPCFLPVL